MSAVAASLFAARPLRCLARQHRRIPHEMFTTQASVSAAAEDTASAVRSGDAVGVRFRAVTADAKQAVVDSSESVRSDAYFVVGDTSVPARFPGLESLVLGLTLRSGAVTKRIPAPFGQRSDANLVEVPAMYVPPGLANGVEVRMGDGRLGTVTKLDGEGVVVDCNHQFAGVDVDLTVEVVAHCPASRLQSVVFGLGCFWSPQLKFDRVPGVMASSVGYANGLVADPTYEDVCTGSTGHTEAVKIYFDPAVVSFETLLDRFFEFHDATQKNRQGNDVGTQYRSGIYATTPEQLELAQAAVAKKNASLPPGKSVASDVEMLKCYYVAEGYHQDYLARGGGQGNAQSSRKLCADPVRCYG